MAVQHRRGDRVGDGTRRLPITPATRKVAMRSAMTMSPDRGGVFDVLLGLVRRRLGGRAGDGKQFVSWIHEHDFVRAVRVADRPRRAERPGQLSRRRSRCRTRSSCGRFARPGECGSGCRRRGGCSKSGRAPANRVGTGAEEPPRRSGPIAGVGVYVRLPDVGRGRPRPVRALAGRPPVASAAQFLQTRNGPPGAGHE